MYLAVNVLEESPCLVDWEGFQGVVFHPELQKHRQPCQPCYMPCAGNLRCKAKADGFHRALLQGSHLAQELLSRRKHFLS
jgi:hypothetical protein